MNLQNYKQIYNHKRNLVVRIIWFIINIVVLRSSIPFSSSFKRNILTCFGAKIGKGVVIKPSVNIKFPWLLEIGDYSWLGEGVWIDNLDLVTIGNNCCLSQGVYLLTGNHDYTSDSFDLITKNIIIEDSSWLGAKSTVCPGVIVEEGAILCVGSVATSDLDGFYIYQGNPATKKKQRKII